MSPYRVLTHPLAPFGSHFLSRSLFLFLSLALSFDSFSVSLQVIAMTSKAFERFSRMEFLMCAQLLSHDIIGELLAMLPAATDILLTASFSPHPYALPLFFPEFIWRHTLNGNQFPNGMHNICFVVCVCVRVSCLRRVSNPVIAQQLPN